MQRVKGNDNIQAGRDVILQVIDGIHSPLDIDKAITNIQEHHDRLLWKRGLLDFRIPLILVIAFAGASAMRIWSLASIPLACGCLFLLYLGVQLQKKLARIDNERTAATLVLVELYKLKLRQNISEL